MSTLMELNANIILFVMYINTIANCLFTIAKEKGTYISCISPKKKNSIDL